MTTVRKCGSGDFAVTYETGAQKDAYDKGALVFEQVKRKTTDDQYKDIDKAIKEVNSTNVLQFLGGFYSGKSHEGIIEYLDDENDKKAKHKITMEGKLNLIKSLVECAAAKGLSNDPAVQQLAQYYELYTTGELKDAKDFNNNGKISLEAIGTYASTAATAGGCIGAAIGGSVSFGILAVPAYFVGTVLGGIAGGIIGCFDKTTDDEVIDGLMKQVFQALKDSGGTAQVELNA